MVSKNRIKVMLIYIFLAIYISIGTVNVYAASGDSPVKNTNDGITIVHRAPQEDKGLTNFGTSFGEDKGHTSQEVGNCDNEGYKMGTFSIPTVTIKPQVATQKMEWSKPGFTKWLKNEIVNKYVSNFNSLPKYQQYQVLKVYEKAFEKYIEDPDGLFDVPANEDIIEMALPPDVDPDDFENKNPGAYNEIVDIVVNNQPYLIEGFETWLRE